MVLMIVLPYVVASFYNNLQILLAIKESRPEVGSSSINTDGSVISSTPIEVRLRSPPEMVFFKPPPIRVSAHFSRPSSLIRVSTFLSYSAKLHLSLSLDANVRASLTVK
jgi:hypothetical protein